MSLLDLSGTKEGSYNFQEVLGQGGLGIVYRAIQDPIGRIVAIKVILPEFANDPNFIRRFESEAQVVARLEHPHIVPLYDFWRKAGRAYLVMRYLGGGSVRDLVNKQGRLSLDVVSRFCRQTLSAMAFAHRNGVVHRDIKPDNVFLDEDGNAYLSDFGIAKYVDADVTATSGQIVGTPAYLAPEQIRGEAATAQSDIYAFGIMLYEMLSGARPFTDVSLATLVYRHLNEPLPMIDHESLNVPAVFNGIIQRATAKTPSERYRDASELNDELQEALRDSDEVVELSLEELDFAELELLETKNPYKGLRAFQQADAADFFGRTDMIARVLRRLQEPVAQKNFLAVIGPSGSGKSSLVKAGVLPGLRNGRIPGSEDWFYAEMVPSHAPLEELSSALLSVSTADLPDMVYTLRDNDDGLARGVLEALPDTDGKLVLMIDQFEELFTQVEKESDRQQFLDLILNAVNVENSPVIIIATLRADFYDRPLLYQGFGELIRSRTELALPLNDDELKEAIEGPAARVGAVLEQGLVDTIIGDVREQPGALPLLQYALTELFERREGALLTIAAYREIGGTLGALAKRAEEVFLRFDEAGQNMARQMFLRLVTLGEGQEDTRRRIMQEELLTLGDSEVVESVIDRFGRYRLLTFDRDDVTRSATIEVAHEALIRQWERLREWLMESRNDVRLERELFNAATEWQAARKDRSYLMAGNRLATFEEWSQTSDMRLNELELEFLGASLAARAKREAAERERAERERRLEAQQKRNLRIAAAVFAVAAVVAVILSLVAFDQSNRANEQRTIAESERERADEQRSIAEDARLVAEEQRGIAEDALHIAEINERKNLSLALAANARTALSEHDSALALPVAIEASHVFEPLEAEVMRVLGAAAFSPGPRFRFTDSPRSILAVAFNSDGSTGAYAGSEGVIYLVNTGTGESVGKIAAGSPINAVAFSQDDALIAAALSDMSVAAWQVADGSEVYRLVGHEDIVTDVEFSADGVTLASSSADSTVRLWDAANGAALHTLEAHIDYVFKLSFSPDSSRLASSSAAIGVRESSRTPDHNTIQVWDVSSGENVLTIPPDGIGFIRDVEFSPDGAKIAATTWSGALGGTVRFYDAETGAEIQRIYAHRDTIANLEFSPDGALLATASRDQSVKMWDIEKGVLVTSYVDLGDRIQDIEFSPNGETLLIGLGEAGSDNPADSSAYLWDLRNRSQAQVYAGHSNWAWAADISPGDSLVASGSGPLFFPASPADLDATVRIWSATTGRQAIALRGHTHTVDSVKFLPDGQRLLSASWDGTIRLWDLNTGREARRYNIPYESGSAPPRVYMIDLLPNGQQFVSGSQDGVIRLWDIESGEVLREYHGHSAQVNGVHISDDGEWMVSASGGWDTNGDDSTVRLWDVATGELLKTFEGHTHFVNYARIAPNKAFIISTSWDDSVRMWDTSTGEELKQFIGHTGNTFGVDITEDSATMLTTSSDTSVRLWDIATGEEINRYEQHSDWVQEVVFSRDESFAVSASQDFTLRRWLVRRNAEDIIEWARENRYIRQLSCAERQSYRLECES